jgi:hypothetical protein
MNARIKFRRMVRTMNTSRALAALTLGIGLFPAGCLYGSDGGDVEAIGNVALETIEDPNGQHGDNGLSPAEFHPKTSLLLQALSEPLFVPSTGALTANSLGILSTPAGRKTFRYAAQCAVASNTTLLDAKNYSYKGGGILNSTGPWPNWGMNDDMKRHTMGCMVTLLNPSGETVPIMLTGNYVNKGSKVGESGFTWKEALWAVDLPSAGAGPIQIHVWPLSDLRNRCYGLTKSAVESRVCGEGKGNCGTIVHNNLNGCTGPSQDVYTTCGSTAVIQSWLDPQDVPTLYDCPPQ